VGRRTFLDSKTSITRFVNENKHILERILFLFGLKEGDFEIGLLGGQRGELGKQVLGEGFFVVGLAKADGFQNHKIGKFGIVFEDGFEGLAFGATFAGKNGAKFLNNIEKMSGGFESFATILATKGGDFLLEFRELRIEGGFLSNKRDVLTDENLLLIGHIIINF